MNTAATVPEPTLVLRRGRHRNRALATYRRTKAIEMATRGCTYQQIADELGYANRGTVHRLVRQTLEAQQAVGVEQLRQVEVQRLDALQTRLWDRAMAGDVEAGLACLRIIQTRIKLLGLTAGKDTAERCQQPQTVILQEHDCRLDGCADHT